MLYKYKLDFRVVHGICRGTVQTMREEGSRRNYVWGKTDIVPSISSSCSSFDREPLYGNVMKKSNIIWAQKTPVNDAPIRLGKHVIHSIAMTNVAIFENLWYLS